MVNGSGQLVRYGGQVMKNVAGYDISRLIAGSMGTLGILLEASFKVLPRPASELTLSFACNQDEAINRMNTWAGQPLPLSGASWWQGLLQLRLSGAVSETARAARLLQTDGAKEIPIFWEELREHHLNFFTQTIELWRLSFPPSTPPVDLEGDCLLDWGGAQRWYRTSLPAQEIRKRAARNGGYATLFKGNANSERFQPMPPALERMQQKIKIAFDPNKLFNIGRMSTAW
jgi:glycolate oxidase FAD binding subunit